MKRRTITKATKARILARQDHRCSRCREWFGGDDKIEYDHAHDLQFGGPDIEANIFAKHAHCHRIHTTQSAKDAGKIRRLTGANKPRRKKAIPSRPFPPASRRMQSRGFERMR